MQKVKINDIEYNIPSEWDDLTFEQYCQVFYDLHEQDEESNNEIINVKNEVKIFSRLIGISEDEILDAPIDFYNKLRDLLSFLYVRESFYYTDADNEIEIDGIKYHIPTQDKIKLRQHIDIDITTQEPDSPTKFIELLAIVLVEEDKEYDGYYLELFEKLKKIKCTTAFKLLGFFLLKGKITKEIINSYTHLTAEINQLHHSTQNL